VSDIITYDKCFGDRFRGVDSVAGRNLPFPTDKASRDRAGATAQPVMDLETDLNVPLSAAHFVFCYNLLNELRCLYVFSLLVHDCFKFHWTTPLDFVINWFFMNLLTGNIYISSKLVNGISTTRYQVLFGQSAIIIIITIIIIICLVFVLFAVLTSKLTLI